jgi:hypothetical protein
MRAVFIFIVLLLLIVLAVPVTFAVQLWSDGRAVIVRAEQRGDLRASATRGGLSTAERTIAMNEFRETWGSRAMPCRTLANLWADLTTDTAPLGTPVSQKLATALMGDRRATSVRWQLRRFVVACQLELRYDDPKLLRAWLANASFGEGLVGMESAAQAAFGKSSRELNAEESARLAVLLRAPSLRTQPERWAERAQQIRGRIEPSDLAPAEAAPAPTQATPASTQAAPAP